MGKPSELIYLAVIMFLLGRWGMGAKPDETFLIVATFVVSAILLVLSVYYFIKERNGGFRFF